MKKFVPPILISAFLLTSCATLFTGSTDNITINSEPEGAMILVEGIELGRTPATVTVKRPGLGNKTVTLQLEGYEDRVFILQKEFNVIALLNFGGFVGWIVDIATGAVMKYNPKNYDMKLRPKNTTYRLEELPLDNRGRYIVPSVNETIIIDSIGHGYSLVFTG